MEEIYFHLPGLFEFFSFYEKFIEIYITESNKFNNNYKIGSIYGAPAQAIWNGGRNVAWKPIVPNEQVVDFVKKYNICCSFTFTNCCLQSQHLYDEFCNTILKDFYFGNNEIIINSTDLEKYIKYYYPNYNFISSTTKCLNNSTAAIDELSKNYHRVVLDYNFNKQFEFLELIENKDKCELLVNTVCQPNCQRRALHYEQISKKILNMETDCLKCFYSGYKFYQAIQNPLFISKEEIDNKYKPLGFKHFKIEGRTTKLPDLIEILTYYLVKPEYQLEIRQRLNILFWRN